MNENGKNNAQSKQITRLCSYHIQLMNANTPAVNPLNAISPARIIAVIFTHVLFITIPLLAYFIKLFAASTSISASAFEASRLSPTAVI